MLQTPFTTQQDWASLKTCQCTLNPFAGVFSTDGLKVRRRFGCRCCEEENLLSSSEVLAGACPFSSEIPAVAVRRECLSPFLRSTRRRCEEEGLSLLLRGTRCRCKEECLSPFLRGTRRRCEEEGRRCQSLLLRSTHSCRRQSRGTWAVESLPPHTQRECQKTHNQHSTSCLFKADTCPGAARPSRCIKTSRTVHSARGS